MKTAARILWGLVTAGVVIYVGLTVWLAFRAIFFPYTLDYGEGDVFWFTRKLALGQNIYLPLGGPPFDSANYPPVAMLLTAALYPLFGDALTFGRWLNFAAALLIAAFIVRFVRTETKNTRIAFLGAGLFLGSTFVYHWVPLYRVDLIGVAFALAGIFCVWRWERVTVGAPSGARQRIFYLSGALLFFLLALYTKHSLLFAPAAAVLAIFLRNRRGALFFALALGGIGGAIFLLLEILTRGGWSFGIFELNATVWTMRVFAPLAQSFVVTYFILLGLALWGWLARVRHKKFGVLEIYAAASLFSLALAGREGAWENYFFEPIAMACVFASFPLVWGLTQKRWQWIFPALLLMQLALFWNAHDPRIALKLFDETRAGNERVGALVRQAAGSVIAEDMGLLWKNGKPVDYYSFVYSTLARAGRYDQKWEIENLRAGNFPLVILNRGTREDVDKFGNFTRAFVSALDFGYRLTSEDARYSVYEPAPLENFEPRAKFGDTFELVGWSLEPNTLRPGEEVTLTIVWRALQQPNARYTTFAHLEASDGSKIAQDDHEPLRGIYPTTHWSQNEMVRDTYRLQIPSTLNAGDYTLRVGWYDTATQDRLSVNGNEDVIELQTFSVP